MKSLKKFFKLLPAFALAFLGGLGAVLNFDYDQAPKIAYADNMSLISNVSLSQYDLVRQSSNSSNAVFHDIYDISLSLYKDLSNGSYSYIYNMTYYLGRSYVISGGTTYRSLYYSTDDTLVYSGLFNSLYDDDYTLVRNVRFFLNTISLSGGGELPSYGGSNLGYFYNIDTFTFSLYIDGFGDYASTTNYHSSVWSQIYDSGSSTVNIPYLNSNSYSYSGYLLINSYQVDLANNNYDVGYSEGYSAGYQEGFNVGYLEGNNYGLDIGYTNGYEAGVESQVPVIETAYNNGYAEGYAEGYSVDSTVATIFSGILQVGALPINILLAIFNFEILGINLSAFISAIFTVCLTVIIIRSIKGGGGSD